MAVTPKTAGAVATVLGGGAAAGVGVHQLSKETPINNELLGKLETIKTKFGLDLENADCKNLLRKDKYSKDDYRAAILGCSKSKTFSAIAKNLGLKVLSNQDKEESVWKDWWTANKENIQKLVTTTNGKTNWTGTGEAQELLVSHCTNTENSQNFSENTTTEKWHNFLIACTKESSGTAVTRSGNLNKDFWTDKSTIKSKIKEAGFALKETLDQNCKTKLEEEFDEYENNYKEAVVACVASDNFEKRAKELELDAYPGTNGDSFWTSGWDDVKDRVSSAAKLTTEEKASWDAAKTKVGAYCRGNNSQNKTIDKTTKDEEWKNYLNACTKEATGKTGKHAEALTKNFWTNKVVTASTPA